MVNGGERMTDVVMLLAPPRSYRLAAYLAAAQALGARPIVASVGVRPLVPDGVTGVQIDLPPDGNPSAALSQAARSLGVRAVVATDDATVDLACEVAASLGLTHNEPNSVRTARRKDLSRRALHAAGCPSPTFFVVSGRLPLAEQLEVGNGCRGNASCVGIVAGGQGGEGSIIRKFVNR